MKLLQIYRCFCDETRLRILHLLTKGPLCVCHFQDILRLPQVAVSKHLACLRANGLAASYVSGYLATDPPPGKDRMIGVDATHAWAAVWTPQDPGQFQWLGLDPTNDQMVDQRYIIVGRGRDYADVPPLRGIIYTNSEKSVIEVAVDVVPFEGDVLHA